jgi:YVTN family beta-propeller protein
LKRLLGFLTAIFGLTSLASGQLAYVTEQNNNMVSVVDTATNNVVATIPVGQGPTAIAANKAGTFVYAEELKKLLIERRKDPVAIYHTGLFGFRGISV